jgi:hypothetical protein
MKPRSNQGRRQFQLNLLAYARVLQLINELLPIKELADRLVGVPLLRQFGLVENEHVDSFLATAFGKSERALVPR